MTESPFSSSARRCICLPQQRLMRVLAIVICVVLLVACSKKEEAPVHVRTPNSAQEPAKGPTKNQAPQQKPVTQFPKVDSPTPSVALDSIDRILASMDWANIAFNTPRKINLNETAQIQLLLSLQKPMDELREAISAAGNREGATVRVSNRMEARLSGANFQITAITTEEQAVGSIDTVEWKWEIKPTTAGRNNLHLTLTALFSVDGSETRRAVRTFDKQIEVEVTAGQRASEFIGKNWQWLWAAIFLPLAGWFWKRWKGKNGAPAP